MKELVKAIFTHHSAIYIYSQINMAQRNKYKENKDRYKFHFNIFISTFGIIIIIETHLSSTLHMSRPRHVNPAENRLRMMYQHHGHYHHHHYHHYHLRHLIKYKSNCISGKAAWISVNFETKRTLN